MPEPAPLQGLIVIGQNATILLLGSAAALVRPRMVRVAVLSADLEAPVSRALLRLTTAVLQKSEAKVSWCVVDLRRRMHSADD